MEDAEVPFPEVENDKGLPFPEVSQFVPQAAAPTKDVPFPEAEPPREADSGLMGGVKYAGKQIGKALFSPVQGYIEMGKLFKEAAKGTGRPTVRGILEEYMRPNPENPEAAPSKEKTVGGAVGNILKSTFTGVRDIGESIATAPVAGALAAMNLYREASKKGEYHYDPTDVFKDWRDKLPEQIGSALIEKYAKNYSAQDTQNPKEMGTPKQGGTFWWETNPTTGKLEKKSASLGSAIGQTLYEDPFGVVTDAMAVKDLGAASVKAIGKTVGSEALVKTANRIAHIESEIAGKIGEKVLPTKWGEYLRNRSEVLKYKGEEAARARDLAAEDANSLLKDYLKLSPEDSKAVRDVHLMGEGAPEESLAAVRAKPELQRAYAAYGEYLKGNREAYLEAEGLLDKKVMQDRVATQYAVAKYGNMEPETLKLAKEEIGKMREFKPVYVPTKREAEVMAASEMIPFEKPERKIGKVPFLERFKGKNPFYETPQEYIPRVVNGWRKVEGNIRWIQKIQDSPTLVRAVSKGEAGRELVIPTHGIFSKYFEGGGKLKAKAVFQRELIAKYGHDEAMAMLLHDAATKKKWRSISDIVAQPAVRHILRFEFMHTGGIPGTLLRGYDRIMNIFRLGATKFNPHYYAGNAVGDAVLSLINGTLPIHLRRGEVLKELMPAQALRSASNVAEGIRGKFSNAFDYLNEVDASTKRGIIIKQVGQHLKDSGIKGFEFDARMKEILPAIENLSDAQVQRARIQEAVAKRVGQSQKLERAEKAANRTLLRAQYKAEETVKAFDALQTPDADAIVAAREETAALKKAHEETYKELVKDLRSRGIKQIPGIGNEEFAANIPAWMRRKNGLPLDEWIGELTTKGYLAPGATERDLYNLIREATTKPKAVEAASVMAKRPITAAEEEILHQHIARGNAALEEVMAAQEALQKIQKAKETLQKDLTRKIYESGFAERSLPRIREQAEIIRPAVARANAFTGDYLGMGPVEQYVFRRLVPFYAFNKTMAMLAFRLPFIAPTSTFLWNRYSAFMASQMDDPENPDYLHNYFPMFVRENGDTVWASMKGLSPFGGVKRSRIWGHDIPSVMAFWEQHPLISVGLKAVGAKTLFSRSSIPYGELLTDAHNGTQYVYQENGSVRKVIDQPGMMKGVSEFFPSVRLAERILIPYQMAPEGWLLNPVPQRDRAGKTTPSLSVWEHPGQVTLDLLGVRTMEKNHGQVKSQEAMKKAGIIRDAIRQIKLAEPDKRPAMIEHLKDFLKAGMDIEGGD